MACKIQNRSEFTMSTKIVHKPLLLSMWLDVLFLVILPGLWASIGVTCSLLYLPVLMHSWCMYNGVLFSLTSPPWFLCGNLLPLVLSFPPHHCRTTLASHRECSRVQDPYTLRCIPQVHGVVRDTIQFVRGILTTEMNSALDNPVSNASHLGWD